MPRAARPSVGGAHPFTGEGDVTTSYRHTQVGYVTLVTAAATALWILALAPRQSRPALWGGAAALLLVGWLFSSLTIEVAGGELRSHFGPGFWRKRVPLADIESAAVVPSRWWEGWGIRVTPRGMLYNVSGTGAVEVRLRSGGRFRLGTDEPESLRRAIERGVGSSAP